MEGATLTHPITHSHWPGWWLRSSFLVGSVWWWWCCPPPTPQAFGMPPSHFLPPLPRPPPPPGSQSGRSTDAWHPPEKKISISILDSREVAACSRGYLGDDAQRLPGLPLGLVHKVQHSWFGGVAGTLSGLQGEPQDKRCEGGSCLQTQKNCGMTVGPNWLYYYHIWYNNYYILIFILLLCYKIFVLFWSCCRHCCYKVNIIIKLFLTKEITVKK